MNTILERTADELRKLNSRRQAVNGIRVRIRMLETDVVGIGGVDFSRPRVNEQQKRSGRTAVVEERDRLRQQEKALSAWIEHVEQSLSQMHPEDQRILRVLYCENRKKGDALRILEQEVHVGRSEIYRMRDKALEDLSERLGFAM